MRLRFAAIVLAAIALVGCSASVSIGGPPEGAGTIKFGTSLTGTDLGGETSTFAVGSTLSWRAVLSENAKTSQLTLVFSSKDAGGALTQIGTQPIPVSNLDSNVFTGTLDLSVTAVGAGTYVLSLTRDTTQLATGTFQVQ
jgi:hypothetical protein